MTLSSIENGISVRRLRTDGVPHQIVAIQRDVERARRHRTFCDFLQAAGKPDGEVLTA
jgi:hypothetical protein